MKRPLRVLLVEDRPEDVELVMHELQEGGFETEVNRVDDAAAMRFALLHGSWDIIISDYHLPTFSAPAALAVLRESGLDLPFLVVTGTIGEERAADVMRAGAQDFVLKDRLSRLAPAVDRALGDARVRTDRNRAMESLRITSQELLTLINESPLAICTLGPTGLVQRWNPAAELLYGWSAQETVGRSMPIEGSSAAVKFAAMRAQVIAGESLTAVELRMERRDHSSVDVALSMAPLPGNEAGAKGILIFACDISERMNLEKLLLKSQKLESLGQLASGIAHEINTPMQFIGDNTTFLTTSFASLCRVLETARAIAACAPEAERARLDAAEQQADLGWLLEEIPQSLAQLSEGIERVTRILKAMKEFAHPGAEEPMPTDINQCIASTLTISRSVWKYVADATTDFAADLPPVPVVLGGFNQVILNLVVNAAHAIEDTLRNNDIRKGAITIRTRLQGNHAVVEVSDTGCGMTPEIRKRLFEPFFTTKELGRGTGQGLAIIRSEIIGRLGGNIEVDSAPGSGSTFRLFLPMQPKTQTTRLSRKTP